ncbi:2-hydroxyacid dehydrogenase [Niabella drilacis]|uniref:Glyoxylate/hydroxypyruvate reductase B n=1 Tax=Niabella drilacis (strain DSM 25811 / CCM 8410 / CCUG 62505 / LMG 26954 / E90) TaxID=1285928 RepID=A0A1G6XYQ2_NIADE|nr:D-glycerate dehydrogenase [Niabella drilacis]SDD82587.1 Lactate dehydrogenase [Niabella drilacis]
MNVFITKQIPQKGLDLLQEAGISYTIAAKTLPQEELIAQVQQYDALLSAGFVKADAVLLEACRHLKVLSLFSVGYDNVDIAAATRLGIPVGNTPGVLSRATADTAFLLMLAVSRKAFYNYHKILDGKWQEFEPVADLGVELDGKVLGIFGLGKIGYEMARKCRAAFDMQVIYHNRNRNEEAEKELGARYVSFEELLAQSDVLSVHANFSPQTKELFDKAAFEKMKHNAIFVNTARGGLHNETDLKAALESNTIWGAGLDVTNPEPMDPANPLLKMPNVCILPHIGSATVETRDAMAVMAAKNVIAGLKGERLPTIVNADVYQ